MQQAEALLIVDMQAAFVTGNAAVPGHAALLEAVQAAIDAARAATTPVIFLQNDGAPGTVDAPHQPGWELHFPPRAHEIVVRKTMDNGFEQTGLDDILTGLGIQTLALCGVLSEMCVAATARGAMQRGYGVILPHDGHATYDVPPGPGGSGLVPAAMAARSAEWSLGDEIIVVASVADIRFSIPEKR